MLQLRQERTSCSKMPRLWYTNCYAAGKWRRGRESEHREPDDLAIRASVAGIETATKKENERKPDYDKPPFNNSDIEQLKCNVVRGGGQNDNQRSLKLGKQSNESRISNIRRLLPFNMSQLFYLPVTINGNKRLALADSGCSTSIIDYNFLIAVGFDYRNCIEKGLDGQVVELACGQEAKIIGLANLNFEIHGRKFRQRIVVSKDEGNPLIFGLPVLSNLNIDINFEKKSYSFRDNPAIEFE